MLTGMAPPAPMAVAFSNDAVAPKADVAASEGTEKRCELSAWSLPDGLLSGTSEVISRQCQRIEEHRTNGDPHAEGP
jgi:hypothetical protein